MTALLHVWSCNEQPRTEAEEPVAASSDAVEGPSLEGLRAMARQSPQEVLNALDARSTQPEQPEQPEVAEIRVLAQTALFNHTLRTLALESDLRQAVTMTLQLAAQPVPINKRRLAQPVWGLIGKLEKRVEVDPTFATAAAKRLNESTILAELVGPQLTQRLSSILTRAEHLEITARVKKLLATMPFDKIVAVVERWSKQPERVSLTQLTDAIALLTEALKERAAAGDMTTLRGDALALLKIVTPLKTVNGSDSLSTNEAQLTTLVSDAGATAMAQWLKTIRRAAKAPVDVARHGCEADRFAETDAEREALAEALKGAHATLTAQAKKAALGYLKAIESRRFKLWRTMEQPFLDPATGTLDAFASQREGWLAANPRLDPRTGALQVATAALDLCKVSLAMTLKRSETTPAEVALTMCWHGERSAWFPCRPLTRATNGAMVRP